MRNIRRILLDHGPVPHERFVRTHLLAKRHSGTITLANDDAGGTVASLSLPAQPTLLLQSESRCSLYS